MASFATGFSDFYELQDSSFRSALSSEIYIEEDTELFKKTGMNFCLIFPQWNRIEPSQGSFDKFMLSQLLKRIEKLKEHHIKPVLVILKDTFPVYFQEQGGFANTENIENFISYASFLIQHTSHLIEDFIIFFEAEKILQSSSKNHLTTKNLLTAYFKVRNLLLELKQKNSEISIGYCLAYHLLDTEKLSEEQKEKALKNFNYKLTDSIFQGRLLFPYGKDEEISSQGGWDYLILKVQNKLIVQPSLFHPSQNFFKSIQENYEPSEIGNFIPETARRYPGSIYLAETYCGESNFASLRIPEMKDLAKKEIIEGYCLIPESIQNDGLRSIDLSDFSRKKGPLFSFFSDIKQSLKHQIKKKEKASEIENPLDDKEPL